jgi:DNA topoisomerase VI subunit B
MVLPIICLCLALAFCHCSVATKIPFKGTSKEYVGEDVTDILQSVRRALQGACMCVLW